MLVGTVTAEAHNTGAVTRYAANGVGFARVIERRDAPDRTCQWRRGKVIGLADRRLGLVVPPLALPAEYDGLRVLLRHPIDVGFGEFLRRGGRLGRRSDDWKGDRLDGFEVRAGLEEFTQPPQPVRHLFRRHELAAIAGEPGEFVAVEVPA